MSNLQNNLIKIKETVDDLANVINSISNRNGEDNVITRCTSFSDYPDILRNLTGTVRGAVTLFAYKVSDVCPSIQNDSGSFDFSTNTYTVPEGWSKASELNVSENDTVWMTQAIFVNSEDKIIDNWSKPIKIGGPSNPATDETIQSVYNVTSRAFIEKPVADNSNPLNYMSIQNGWSLKFNGVTESSPNGFISSREKLNGVWTDYSEPKLFAHYGNNGDNGKDGISSKIVFAFTSTTSIDDKPSTPSGGKWHVEDNGVIYPSGWVGSVSECKNKYIWTSTATFTSKDYENPAWSIPSCITGKDGDPGKDSDYQEFIYAIIPSHEDFKLFKSYIFREGIGLENKQEDNIVPGFIIPGSNVPVYNLSINRNDSTSFTVNITDSPCGISDLNKIEIYWVRTKTNGKWGSWSEPLYWSVWGENGMDGDGIEYIYSVSNDNSADNDPSIIYPDKWIINDVTNEKVKNPDWEEYQKSDFLPDGWTDDDIEVNMYHPFLFCSIRKQFIDEDGDHVWGPFSSPKLWGHYGKDGDGGSFTSFAFCVTSTNLSKYSVHGGTYDAPLHGLKTVNELGEIDDSIKWTDSPDRNPSFDESIWMINKFFTVFSNNKDNWTGPVKLADSEKFQVEFNCPSDDDPKSKYNAKLISLEEFKHLKSADGITFKSLDDLENAWRSYAYENNMGLWSDSGENATYMATASFVDNKWSEWSVNKIKGESGNSTQFIFILTNGSTPKNPNYISVTNDEYQNDSYKPSEWSYSPESVTEEYPVCWSSQRLKINNKWGEYSEPAVWSMYAKGNVHLELSDDYINIPCDTTGKIDSSYKQRISTKFLLYDNGRLVTDAKYEAVINNKFDLIINNQLNYAPTDFDSTGFFNNTLYIGKSFIDQFNEDAGIKIECRAIYKDVSYAKTCRIIKSTNTYELSLSHSVLCLDNNGKFKDDVLRVSATKWSFGDFYTLTSGFIECVFTDNKYETHVYKSELDPDGIEEIPLWSYNDIKNIQIYYKESADGAVLTQERIETVRDGNDGAAGISRFTSFVFTRSAEQLNHNYYKPKGGSYNNPIPDKDLSLGIEWTDGIPEGNDTIWMSCRVFSTDDSIENTEWSIPSPAADSADVDMAWSILSDMPTGDPLENNQNGNGWIGDPNDPDISNAIWMASRIKSNGTWSKWSKYKIKGEAGDFMQFIFTLDDNPSNPNSDSSGYQNDEYIPSGWSLNPLPVSAENSICWFSKRIKHNGTWEAYSAPTPWSMYAFGNIHLELTEDEINIPCEPDGRVDADYSDFIDVGMMFYDDNKLIDNVSYEAILNGNNDIIIPTFDEKPTVSTMCGFYKNKLYIGKDFISRYSDLLEIRIECAAIYKSSRYSKVLIINKIANPYELKLSHNVLTLDKDYKFKDSSLKINAYKWIKDNFINVNYGKIKCILTKYDNSTRTIEFDYSISNELDLTTLDNVKSIKIQYWPDNTGYHVVEEIGTVKDGADGTFTGDVVLPPAQFKSFVFTWSVEPPDTPKGGTYYNPEPTTPSNVWSDGIIKQPSVESMLWYSSAWFESHDDFIPSWSEPQIVADSTDFDVEFSSEENPLDPIGHPNVNPQWSSTSDDSTIWMATSKLSHGVWSDWQKSKIKGEKGKDGTSISVKGSLEFIKDLPEYGNITGDSYIINGELYVWDGDSWENCGSFKGDDGKPSYLHIKYANKADVNTYQFIAFIANKQTYMSLSGAYGEEIGDYIGIFSDDIAIDPNISDDRFKNYQWKYWKGSDGYNYEYIYIRTKDNTAPVVPESVQEDNHVPNTNYSPDWTDSPSGVTKQYPYEWMAHRIKKDGIWGNWTGSHDDKTKAVLWSYYGASPDYYVYIYAKGTKPTSTPNIGISVESLSTLSGWYDYPDESDIQWWQCIGHVDGKSNTVNSWSEIIPVNGNKGKDGSHVEFRFKSNDSKDEHPAINVTSRIPYGWELDSGLFSDDIANGKFLWMINAKIDSDDNLIGEWSIPIRISGEQGPKGDTGPQGPPGANGGFGPMARYTVWDDVANRPSYYFSREAAEIDGSKWYDIVTYNNCYYLCVYGEPVSSTVAPTPGTNSDVWEKSSHFSFLTADNAAIQDLVSERIQADKTVTKTLVTKSENSAMIKIENGTMLVYGNDTDKHADIIFGVEDGVSVLKFFDKNGTLLYDLGPMYGLRAHATQTIDRFSSGFSVIRIGDMKPSEYDRLSDYIVEILDTFNAGKVPSPVMIYKREKITNNVIDTEWHDKWCDAANTSATRITGTYIWNVKKWSNKYDVSDENRYSIINWIHTNPDLAEIVGLSEDWFTSSLNSLYGGTINYYDNGTLTDISIVIYWTSDSGK